MSLNTRLVTIVFCSWFVLLGAAFGQKASIEADVKGVDGRPSKNAEIRIERRDKTTQPVIVKTDGRGHLTATSLEAGTYKVTAIVEGGVQSSQVLKTQTNKAFRVTFDLGKTAAMTGKAKRRYVWVHPQTGTRFGGHWEEAGEASGTADPSERNIDKLNGNSMDNIQRQSLSNTAPGRP